MGCILGLVALIAPRLVLVLLWFFSDYLSEAFGTWLWPLIGFFVLPLTTLAWAFSAHSLGGATPLGIGLVVLAFLADIGVIGGVGRGRRRD